MIFRVLYILAAIMITVYTTTYGIWEYHNNSRSAAVLVLVLTAAGVLQAIAAVIVY